MPLEGEYEPSASDWVREQVETYEATGGREANTLRETGIPVVIVTSRGATTGKLRKFALMRVEHGAAMRWWPRWVELPRTLLGTTTSSPNPS
jgi:F420H(2)-dependent quinone reductase